MKENQEIFWPIPEPPQGALPSPINFDIASFFSKLAFDLSTNLYTFVNKVTIYLWFLRLQRRRRGEKPIPSLNETVENRAKLSRSLQTAGSADLHKELDRLFDEGFDGDKELALPVLRDAIIVSRSDRRFYLAQKKEIEQLLQETIFFDESYDNQQKEEIKKTISSFASLYETLLMDQIVWGLSQTNPETIQETLLVASQLKTGLPSFSQEEQEVLPRYMVNLSEKLSCLNMFREEWQDQEKRALSPAYAPQKEVRLTVFLFFLTRSLPTLTPAFPSLLSQAPGLWAFASISLSSLFSSFEETTEACLIQAALSAHLLSHFSTLFFFEKSCLREPELTPFIKTTPPPSLSLLLGLLQVWHSLFPHKAKDALFSLITFLGLDSLVTYLLLNPTFTPPHDSFWKMEQLSLSQFIQAKDKERQDTFSPPEEECVVQEPGRTDSKGQEIVQLLEAVFHYSSWPELTTLLEATLQTVRVKKRLNQTEWESLSETTEALLQAASPEKETPSFCQLFRFASEQANMYKNLFT